MDSNTHLNAWKAGLRRLRRRWPWMTLPVVLCLAAAWSHLERAPRKYTATTTLVIERPVPVDLGVPGLIREIQEAGRFNATQRQLLASRTLIEAVVESQGLRDWPEFAGLESEDLIEAVRDQFEIEPVGESSLVEVSFVGTDRDRVDDVVNDLADLYLAHVSEREKRDLRRNLEMIEIELPRLEEAREEAQREREAFKTRNSALTFDGRKEILQSELKQQSSTLQSLRDRHDHLQVRRDLVARAREDADLAALTEALELELPKEYTQELLQLQSQRTAAASSQGARTAELESLDGRIVALEATIEAERARAVEGLEIQFQVAATDLETAQRRHGELERAAAELDQVELRYDALVRRVEDANELYDRLVQRREELLVLQAGVGDSERIWVQDRAHSPLRPSSPRTVLTMVIAGLLGVLLGIAAAIVRERLDDRLGTMEDPAQAFDLSPVAWVPQCRSGNHQPAAQWLQSGEGFPADEFRKLLGEVSEDGPGRVYTVLSAVPREGKTSMSTGLALAAARSGYRTLLIDADLKKPQLHEVHGFDGERGFIEVLGGREQLEDVLVSTPVETLSVLPAGTPSASLEKLTRRSVIEAFLDRMRQEYQVVVVDTSPVLFSSDCLLFARAADERYLVTSYVRSRYETTRRALDQIHQAGIELKGTVINHYRSPMGKYGNGYGYGYGYATTGYPGEGVAEAGAETAEAPAEGRELVTSSRD